MTTFGMNKYSIKIKQLLLLLLKNQNDNLLPFYASKTHDSPFPMLPATPILKPSRLRRSDFTWTSTSPGFCGFHLFRERGPPNLPLTGVKKILEITVLEITRVLTQHNPQKISHVNLSIPSINYSGISPNSPSSLLFLPQSFFGQRAPPKLISFRPVQFPWLWEDG